MRGCNYSLQRKIKSPSRSVTLLSVTKYRYLGNGVKTKPEYANTSPQYFCNLQWLVVQQILKGEILSLFVYYLVNFSSVNQLSEQLYNFNIEISCGKEFHSITNFVILYLLYNLLHLLYIITNFQPIFQKYHLNSHLLLQQKNNIIDSLVQAMMIVQN